VIEYETRSGWLGTLLSLVGAVAVGYFLVTQGVTGYITGWVFAVGIVSVVCFFIVGEWSRWATPFWLSTAAAITMTVFGGIGAAPSNGLLLVPAAIGVLRLLGEPRIQPWVGCAAAGLSGALVALGALGVTMTPLGLLSMEAGLLLGVLGGFNRRQARAARERQRELAERTIIAREEHARVTLLEQRQSIARDIHDVLAHSLGGVVVQLNAVEALLEAGKTDDAERRIRDARDLAASGLGEARRAVEALRMPTDDADATDAADLVASLRELVSTHRSLAGAVTFSVDGAARTVPSTVALALRRTLQESLSNARKHAAGQPVTAQLDWHDDRVVLTVTNPLPVSRPIESRSVDAGHQPGTDASGGLASGGGGNGLPGIRERFAELAGGSAFAGIREDCFVVRAEAGLE
jgi:signal transduction histidine kinase